MSICCCTVFITVGLCPYFREWKLVAMSDEMEISTSNQLNLQLEKDGNIEIAGDCQLEFGYRQCVVFEPFQV
jgi:hypothetical protein